MSASRRAAAVPRSVIPLLILLIAASLWLWRGSGDDEGEGPAPIFESDAETIVGCDVRGPQRRVSLELHDGAWRLGGDLPDLADTDGVTVLLDALTGALRSEPVAVGGEWTASQEDYGLQGRSLFEITLTYADGRSRGLRIGARNPATGMYYATGAGSDALFLVDEPLIAVVAGLPGSVRARMLWPEFHRGDVDTVRIRFAGREGWDLMTCDRGGRWWLCQPDDGWARAGETARVYHERFADRRREQADATWLRVRGREVRNLLSYLERLKVRDYDTASEVPPQDGFAVHVSGAGGPAHEIVVGAPRELKRVLAWRDGFPGGLVVSGEFVEACGSGLPHYLHTDVLTRGMAGVDSFAIERANYPELRYARDGKDWRVTAPTGIPDPERLKLMALDLAFYLDHLAIEAVMELPADGGDPLDQPVSTVTFWRTGPGVPPRSEIRFGVDAARSVPAAWLPDEERLVRVDRDILFTFQSMLMAAGDGGR